MSSVDDMTVSHCCGQLLPHLDKMCCKDYSLINLIILIKKVCYENTQRQ